MKHFLLAFAALALAVLIFYSATRERAGSPQEELTVEGLEALRDEIIEDIEAIRETDFLHPVEVATADRAWLEAYARERSAKMLGEAMRAADEEVVKLLCLVPADVDLQQMEIDLLGDQALGFYEPSLDTFYVMQGKAAGGLLSVTLAHELTHALDDQLWGIDDQLLPLMKESTDAGLAFHAVVEGSGILVMNHWTAQQMAAGKLDLAELEDTASLGAGLEDAPELLWKPMLHSYFQGAAFLSRTESVMQGQMAALDNADIARAFEDPPKSTEQVLHPAKYWDPAQRDDPMEVALDTSALAAGWSVLREDTLGELLLALVTTPFDERKSLELGSASLATEFTNDAARGWGGDRYAYVGRGDARLLALATTWDRLEDAEEFRAALSGMTDAFVRRAAEIGGGKTACKLGGTGKVVTMMLGHGIDLEEAAGVHESIGVEIEAPDVSPARD